MGKIFEQEAYDYEKRKSRYISYGRGTSGNIQ